MLGCCGVKGSLPHLTLAPPVHYLRLIHDSCYLLLYFLLFLLSHPALHKHRSFSLSISLFIDINPLLPILHSFYSIFFFSLPLFFSRSLCFCLLTPFSVVFHIILQKFPPSIPSSLPPSFLTSEKYKDCLPTPYSPLSPSLLFPG